jgi:hypothetical protein
MGWRECEGEYGIVLKTEQLLKHHPSELGFAYEIKIKARARKVFIALYILDYFLSTDTDGLL